MVTGRKHLCGMSLSVSQHCSAFPDRTLMCLSWLTVSSVCCSPVAVGCHLCWMAILHCHQSGEALRYKEPSSSYFLRGASLCQDLLFHPHPIVYYICEYTVCPNCIWTLKPHLKCLKNVITCVLREGNYVPS